MVERRRIEPDYVVRRLSELLAREEGELGIVVEFARGILLLTGTVPTAERRERVEALALRVCPDLEIRNEISVLPPAPGGETEALP